ncbi:endoribonuclease rege-1 isoform X1 [Culex quinquefasciatus]|uniref:endoribonuclease rege-1 isoform X1 n=1 Tax=Culex quinquefasciatus TaxID=7176 RepID=UPI0018E3C081|nr:endoribonuclease rege-1 isoform X1 [Culex quinquefasciatus]
MEPYSAAGKSVVRIRRKCLGDHIVEKLSVLFGVQLGPELAPVRPEEVGQFATFHVYSEQLSGSVVGGDSQLGDVRGGAAGGVSGDLISQIQQYLDSLCVTEAEDSSYDSDCDGDDLSHQQVSRTTSDTLGQEFAEYVSSHTATADQSFHQDRSPGYTQRVEFALKLGYTERLVQAALQRLGPNPAQNELLAELIKLGSQPGVKGTTGEFIAGDGGDSLLAASTEYGAPGLLLVPPGPGSGSSVSASEESLRPIVIDGSNVAMSHGNKEVFSCRGIRLCVDWFKNRGHKDITVFVPKWRKESARPDNPVKDGEILNELEKERMLVFTPSRLVGGKRMVCYDDRYILKLAAENDGIVVSNDNYRDLVQESSEFKKVVEERVLMYSFVNDRFMPPDDPLGRSGPTLDNFLRVRKGDPPPPCPYGKKCTYGNKCKFYHPERGSMPHKSVTERLSEYAARHLQARSAADVAGCSSSSGGRNAIQGKSLSVPLSNSSSETSPINEKRKPLCRTRSNVPPETGSSSVGNMFNMSQGDQQQHQHLQQNPYMPTPNRSNWDISPLSLPPHSLVDSQIFPKSHSIENISKETYTQLQHSYSASLWNRQQQQQQQQAQSQQQKSESCEPGLDPTVNLHRKLQRQLTLNPAGCDPRIYQMQRNVGHQQQTPQHHSAVQLSPHRPLAPSLSGGARPNPAAAQWELHQNVTRIASAPDPSRPWHTGPPPASSSEPHINLWPPPQNSASSGVIGPPQQQQPTTSQQQQQAHQQLQDQRRRLHYHLASIFPEDQVQAVMQMYPDETNPQKICAAILAMFPKM